MKFWWLTHSQRLSLERATVERLVGDEPWLSLTRWLIHDGRLAAECEIAAHGKFYQVRLVYPDQFPEVPAWVEPQEDTRWSSHQYGKGAFCLERRPDNWTPISTGADLLRSCHDLFVHEDPLGEGAQRAPSEHNVGEVQAYDWGINPVLIGKGCADRLKNNSALDVKALRWMATADVWPILIHDSDDRNSSRMPPTADINSWRFEIPVFISRSAIPEKVLDRQALACSGQFNESQSAAILGSDAGLVLFTSENSLGALHLIAEGAAHPRRIIQLPDDQCLRTSRAASASTKSVAVIGMGSIGSKLSESLVRAGVRTLTIVDGDVMLPGNLERHALDWRDVGFRKASGMQRRLHAISPGASIEAINDNLNWQRSAKTHAWQVEEIAKCDIVVDATGDLATALFLAAVAEANDKPFVSVQVFEGGFGGFIAACIPKRDPSFVTGRSRYIAWCEERDVAAPEPGPRSYEILAGDGFPLVADDASVTATAAHAARIVLDILDDSPPPSTASWLLLGYRKEWLFDGHGHNYRLDVGPPSPAPSDAVDQEAFSWAAGLFKEWLGADKSSV